MGCNSARSTFLDGKIMTTARHKCKLRGNSLPARLFFVKRLRGCTNAEQDIMSGHQGYKRLDEEDEHEGGATSPKGVVESRAIKLYQTLLLGLAMLLIVRKEQNTRSSDELRCFLGCHQCRHLRHPARPI